DMPVILGPDGPSLGGFVCPATVISADRWKLGQLKAGDRLRFVPLSLEDADRLAAEQDACLAGLSAPTLSPAAAPVTTPILDRLEEKEDGPEVVYRAAGDRYLLVEYGPLELDLRLRFRAHALMLWLQEQKLDGILE
ncbi:MAG TPA: urea carboxylase, partial [Alcanivorax sp.]|nr:urea carboxylase [Alcanivorax sp.]